MDIRVEVMPDRRRTLRALRRSRRRKTRAVQAYGAVLLLVGILTALSDAEPTWTVVFLALGVTLVVINDLTLLWAVQRMPRPDGPTVIELTEERLRSSSSLAAFEIPWTAVARVDDSDEFWFLRLTPRGTLAIPKQALSSQQQAELGGFLANRVETPLTPAAATSPRTRPRPRR